MEYYMRGGFCSTPIVTSFKRIKQGFVQLTFMKVYSSKHKDLNAQGINLANLKEKCLVLAAETQQHEALY